MALKTNEKQALIAELKLSIAEFFLGWQPQLFDQSMGESPKWIYEITEGQPVFYKVIDQKCLLVKHWPRHEIVQALHIICLNASENCGYFHRLGSESVLSLNQMETVFDTIVSYVLKSDHPNKARVRPVGDMPVKPGEYVLHRLPYALHQAESALMIRGGMTPSFGKFIDSLREHFVDPKMFDILCCFIARAVTEDRYSEEFLFWFGEGGDGKGTLMSYLIDLLGSQAAIVQPSDFDSRFGASSYAHLRLAVIDEFSRKFDLWSAKVKTLTGMGSIPVERKGKDIVHVPNRLLMIFLSNEKPKFQKISSQMRRFRYIESKPRIIRSEDRQDRDELKQELDTHFPRFLSYCACLYLHYKRRIPETNSEHLDELAKARIDPFYHLVASNFRYMEGAFVSFAAIEKLLGRQMQWSQPLLTEAFGMLGQSMEVEFKPGTKRLNGKALKGIYNAAFIGQLYPIDLYSHLVFEPPNAAGLKLLAQE